MASSPLSASNRSGGGHRRYLIDDHQWRTHVSLDKDAPIARAVQPPSDRPIAAVPHVGGLHHHDERRAA